MEDDTATAGDDALNGLASLGMLRERARREPLAIGWVRRLLRHGLTRELLGQLVQVILCCCVTDHAEGEASCAFVSLLASDDDYSAATFDKALAVVRRENVLDDGALLAFARPCYPFLPFASLCYPLLVFASLC